MKRFRKIYVEISNICNLRCNFCPGTTRKPMRMEEDAFASLLPELSHWTDYVYFHLMGEPLCHPNLGRYLQLAADNGLKVIITTNGTLLKKQQDLLINSDGLHKVNISLHAFEANDLAVPFKEYLNDCMSFGMASAGKKLICYRLWNQGGADSKNSEILAALEHAFPKPWKESSRGIRLTDGVYLEYGEKFDWPDMSAEEDCGQLFCYGLRDQIGILCDGTVVPCCLDHNGDIPLGNIFESTMEEILKSKPAKAIYDGFSNRIAVHPLCRRCGYARRFR